MARKNGLKIEVHGSKGMLGLDNERMNELQLYQAEGPPETRGFRTILSGPLHPPYASFCPAPGHGLGFNDLKVMELAEILKAIQRAGLRTISISPAASPSRRSSTPSPALRKSAPGWTCDCREVKALTRVACVRAFRD